MTFEKVFKDLKKIILKTDTASLTGSFAFQCCITGDGAGTFYIAFQNGELAVEPFDYEDNTATFKASAEVYKSILTGEITASEAVEAGTLIVENNEYGSCADILTFLSGKTASAKTVKEAAAGKQTRRRKSAAEKAAEPVEVKEEIKPVKKTRGRKPAAKAEPTEIQQEAKEEVKPMKKNPGRKPAVKTEAKKTRGRKASK